MRDPTARQLEVLAALGANGSRKGAAAALGVSEHAIRGDLERLYRRLGVGSAIGAAFRLWGPGAYVQLPAWPADAPPAGES